MKEQKKTTFSLPKFRLFFHYQNCNQVNMNISEMFLLDTVYRDEVTMKILQAGHPSQLHLFLQHKTIRIMIYNYFNWYIHI